MLMLLSPAKKLDMTPQVTALPATKPDLLEHSQTLIDILKEKDAFEIAELMKLSMKLSDLNVARYQAWKLPFDADNAKQALWAFRGDVYQTLDADSLTEQEQQRAQQHLRILSGLYGLLRPSDWMQAYRLEMGTRLSNPRGKDLYAFWGDRVTQQVASAMQEQGDDVVVNLASLEYAKVLRPSKLHGRIVTPVFKEWKNGQWKVIGIYAKRARGLMARFVVQHGLQTVDELKAFDVQGYQWRADMSDAATLVFTRNIAAL